MKFDHRLLTLIQAESDVEYESLHSYQYKGYLMIKNLKV